AWLLLPAALLFINPGGYEGVLYPFQFAMKEALVFKHFNLEWFPAYHPAFRFAHETIAFWALSFCVFAVLLRGYLQSNPGEWGVRAAFAMFAFANAAQAVRFIPWASFVMIMAVKPWSILQSVRLPRKIWVPVACTLLLGLAAKNAVFGYKSS